jgi:hypothetical protein
MSDILEADSEHDPNGWLGHERWLSEKTAAFKLPKKWATIYMVSIGLFGATLLVIWAAVRLGFDGYPFPALQYRSGFVFAFFGLIVFCFFQLKLETKPWILIMPGLLVVGAFTSLLVPLRDRCGNPTSKWTWIAILSPLALCFFAGRLGALWFCNSAVLFALSTVIEVPRKTTCSRSVAASTSTPTSPSVSLVLIGGVCALIGASFALHRLATIVTSKRTFQGVAAIGGAGIGIVLLAEFLGFAIDTVVGVNVGGVLTGVSYGILATLLAEPLLRKAPEQDLSSLPVQVGISAIETAATPDEPLRPTTRLSFSNVLRGIADLIDRWDRAGKKLRQAHEP